MLLCHKGGFLDLSNAKEKRKKEIKPVDELRKSVRLQNQKVRM